MADSGEISQNKALEITCYGQALKQLLDFTDELLKELGSKPTPDDVEQWKTQRANTIRVLNEFKEKLDTVCVSTNSGMFAGYVAQIFGVIGAVIGVIMSTFRQRTGPMITNTGNLVQHTGSWIENTSKAIEFLCSGVYMSKIQKVLKADQKLSLPLAESLSFSKELDINVQRIFGVSLASEKWSSVLGMFQEILKIVGSGKSFDASIRDMKQDRYSVNIEEDEMFGKVHQFFRHLSAFPNLTDQMQKTLQVLTLLTSTVNVYNPGVRLYRYCKDIPTPPIGSILRSGLEPEIPSAKEVSVFCLFQAINLANSVISLINAKNVIKKGKSKYSEALSELISLLTNELESMKGF